MKDMVEIEVVLDDKYVDPKVTIRTKTNSQQVENIIYAIENASEHDFPQLVAQAEGKQVFVSQRDIIRVHTQGRKVVLQTDDAQYVVKKTVADLEDRLNPKRFLRISQSEIINLYKVKCFDIGIAGTVGVEFDNGMKTWASRSRVRDIKAMLKAI